MIRLAIFDLDGTLVNAYPAVTSSVNYTLAQLGYPKQSALVIKKAVGGGDRQLMIHFVGEELATKALALYRPHHLKALQHNVRLLPGAHSLLKWCKQKGYLVALATNRPSMFTKEILKCLKVDGLFDQVLCADQAKRPKPYPDMLIQICRELKVKKQDAFYVGDMTIDIECGSRAKMTTIAVATGSNTKKELNQLKPYKIIDNVSQLKGIIPRLDISSGRI